VTLKAVERRLELLKLEGLGFSQPGDQNWNIVADIAPPIDKIDIYDIVTAAGNYGESW